MTDRVGQQIGNYRLHKVLGSGGFADVYLGQHVHLKKRQVAIKFMRDVLHANFQVTFLEEAETIADLKHLHIVQLLDYGIEDTNSLPYLIMEYAQKGTLRDLYPRGSIVPLDVVIIYVKQIASALQYAHDQDIIHRDLKPENLLVRDTDEVILSDFGIAAVAQNSTLLKTTGYAGTVQYSAPEQHQGKPRVASDQYALGIVVYEWLCGATPFRGSTQIEIVLKHLSEAPQPLRERISTIPFAVEAVVMKALEKDPKHRFGSVKAFGQALEAACSHTSPSIHPLPFRLPPSTSMDDNQDALYPLQSSSSPQTNVSALTAAPDITSLHFSTPPPDLSDPAIDTGSSHPPGSGNNLAQARAARRKFSWRSLIVAVVVVTMTLLFVHSYSLAPATPGGGGTPTLTLQGKAILGQSITLTGSHFRPNKVAVMLDGQPLGSGDQNQHPSGAPLADMMNVFSLLTSQTPAAGGWIMVKNDGTFTVDIPINSHWSNGSKHFLNVYGQDSKFITSTTFTVETATPLPTK